MDRSAEAGTARAPTVLRRGTVIFLPHMGLGLIRCEDGRVVSFLESSVVGSCAGLRTGDAVRVVERCGTPSWVETVLLMRRRPAVHDVVELKRR